MEWLKLMVAWLTGLFAAGVTPLGAPGEPPGYAAAFERAFASRYEVVIDEADDGEPAKLVTVGFRNLDLGTIQISSGTIAACDPFVSLDNTKPFLQSVPNGTFPVQLAVATAGDGQGRVAFARVAFADRPIVRWRMALVAGQDLSTLKPGEAFGYGVDAGTGAFYDPATGETANRLLVAEPNAWEAWQTDGESNGKAASYEPNFFLLLKLPPGNIAMFASGWGDGFYTSWFGYDADDKPVALVTDFLTIDWTKAKPQASP
jgi:Protein of unknown function (DUF4241)